MTVVVIRAGDEEGSIELVIVKAHGDHLLSVNLLISGASPFPLTCIKNFSLIFSLFPKRLRTTQNRTLSLPIRPTAMSPHLSKKSSKTLHHSLRVLLGRQCRNLWRKSTGLRIPRRAQRSLCSRSRVKKWTKMKMKMKTITTRPLTRWTTTISPLVVVKR